MEKQDLLRAGYFGLLRGLAEAVNDAVELLENHTARRGVDSPELLREGILKLTSAADDRLHSLRTKLLRDFITPLDREDIFALALSASAALAHIRSIADSVYIYSLTRALPREDELSAGLRLAAAELTRSYGAVGSIKKNNTALNSSDEVLRLCDSASQTLVAERRAAAFSALNPAELTVRAELYEKYYACLSAFRDAANSVAMAVLKNV